MCVSFDGYVSMYMICSRMCVSPGKTSLQRPCSRMCVSHVCLACVSRLCVSCVWSLWMEIPLFCGSLLMDTYLCTWYVVACVSRKGRWAKNTSLLWVSLLSALCETHMQSKGAVATFCRGAGCEKVPMWGLSHPLHTSTSYFITQNLQYLSNTFPRPATLQCSHQTITKIIGFFCKRAL